jgi:hypothetical protein
MLHSTSVNQVNAFVVIIGMGRCFINVITPLVIADMVEPQKFTMAMGIFLSILGGLKLGLGTIVGKFKNHNNLV